MTVIVAPGHDAANDGANFLHYNLFELGTLTWSTQADGYPALNVISDETWNAWRPASGGYQSFQVDHGIGAFCDCLGVAAHNFASVGARFGLDHSSNGSSWTTVFGAYAPLTNDTHFVFFQGVTARYWRFWTDTAIPTVGVVKLGWSLKLPHGPVDGHKPIHHAKRSEMLANQSLGGSFLGNRVVRQSAQTSINLGPIDRDFVENDMAAFERDYNNGRTFFYCGNPRQTPKDMGYCRRPNNGAEMEISWTEGDALADVSMEVEAYVAT